MGFSGGGFDELRLQVINLDLVPNAFAESNYELDHSPRRLSDTGTFSGT
jgi:hypothetical protein